MLHAHKYNPDHTKTYFFYPKNLYISDNNLAMAFWGSSRGVSEVSGSQSHSDQASNRAVNHSNRQSQCSEQQCSKLCRYN